ncbi:MAG: NifU N-terminal domain-containing protein [Phycisphaerales bacterium]|nr:NifU N-terminal domain-containing protein [Phycisphaerales bacterium]
MRITQFQATPNPNALKCVIDHRLPDTPRSYFSAAQVNTDPLAARLFAIPGITNLLIHESFITVGKDPAADWKPIKAALELTLRDFKP